VVVRIQALRTDPRPPGSEKLSGHHLYRVRQGSYRVLYSVDDDTDGTIVLIKIGHRREVYP